MKNINEKLSSKFNLRASTAVFTASYAAYVAGVAFVAGGLYSLSQGNVGDAFRTLASSALILTGATVLRSQAKEFRAHEQNPYSLENLKKRQLSL